MNELPSFWGSKKPVKCRFDVNVLVNREGELDWGKLRKYMGFYTMRRDLDGSEKYESRRKIRDVTLWNGKSIYAFQNRSYRQVDSNPDCDNVKNEDERRDLPT